MDFVFNELSLLTLSQDTHSAKTKISTLIKLCKTARELGMNKLAVNPNFYSQNLCPNFSIMDWLDDRSVSFNLKNLLQSILRYPYIIKEDTEIENRFISSYTYLMGDNTVVEGLAVAYLYNTIALSMASEPTWNCSKISLRFLEDGADDQSITVNHGSDEIHLDEHSEWISRRLGTPLAICPTAPESKEIKLRDDHGKDLLLKFSKKLARSQYVVGIINSMPFNPASSNFIKSFNENGIIEIVLTKSDRGLGIVVQTTGGTLTETEQISKLLESEFSNAY